MMMQSITSSYDTLPDHMKPCFLYLSLFPVEFEICPEKLAKLWISEDFVTETTDDQDGQRKTEEYLEVLSQRCMIQVASKRYDGLPKTYRIHNIFRQMCIAEAKKYGFFGIVDDDQPPDPSLSSSAAPRRLAVYKSKTTSGDYWYASHLTSSLRSILCFRGCTVHLPKLLTRSVHLLRVLHLEGSHLHEKALPETIGGAPHLRYLNLRGTGIESLPSSIGNLIMLGYLNLRDTGITSLPSSIGDLVMLEFLDLRGNHLKHPIPTTAFHKLTRLKELHMDTDATSVDGDSLDVSSLSGLRTLSIRAGRWMKDGLSKLVHLKSFRLYGDLGLLCNSNNADALPKCLSELTKLHFFRLGIGFKVTIPNLDLGSILLNESLHSLELKRSLGRLPAPNEMPSDERTSSLTYLCLKFSQLKRDPMPTLKKLPHLRVLRLRFGSFLGEKMVCSGGGFKKLQILEVAMLNELEEWMVEEKAMPVLRRLVVSCCNQLKMLPQGQLHQLEELEVSGMPQTFNVRLKGEDWNKIRHVKSITVDGVQMKAADASNECTTTATADGTFSSNLRQVTDAADVGL